MDPIQLISQIRSGPDRRAGEARLYVLTRDALIDRLARKIPPYLKSRLDAEDVLQEAFLRAMQGLESFTPSDEESFYAWVYRIARNFIVDTAKRRSAAAIHFVRREDEKGPRASALLSPRKGCTTEFRDREWIDSVLDQLPPREREVIRLRQLMNWSYEEIASAWNSTPGAVKMYHSRAWRRLCAIARRSQS